MGMYSTFTDENIKVIDANKLKVICFDFKKNENFKGLVDEDELKNENFGECVSFQAWDENKIQGYWYGETTEILDKLATCIEGFVEFRYEEGYLFRIVFKDGKWFYQEQPTTEWEKIPMERIKINRKAK